MESSHREVKTRALTGVQLLIVEDDFLLLLDLEEILVAEKEEISAAILDVRIGAQNIVPVARKLAPRGTPFVFYTGQLGNDPMMEEWPGCRTLSKPALPQMIVNAVAELLRARALSA